MSLSLINNIQMFMTDSEYDRAKGKSIHATLPKGHDRQLAAQAEAFEKEGGFTERLYRVRQNRRRMS